MTRTVNMGLLSSVELMMADNDGYWEASSSAVSCLTVLDWHFLRLGCLNHTNLKEGETVLIYVAAGISVLICGWADSRRSATQMRL